MTKPNERVVAVVVTFHPDPETLLPLLDSLASQVFRTIVVDNTPAECGDLPLVANCDPARLEFIRLGSNTGIAKALNVGIQRAVQLDPAYVLLSDQDSLPAQDMVARLLESARELIKAGRRVGAIGPVFTDQHTGTTYPFQAQIPGKFFYGHLRADAGHPIVEAVTLITSGMLIPVRSLVACGAMREDFFIDQVDIEWCHRVRAQGYELFGAGRARMFHRMGDARLKVWYFGWRSESAYVPVRVYYRLRNFVAICRLPFVRTRWKIRSAWYWLGFLYSQVVFGQQRARALKMGILGLWDGLRGRMGPHS